MAFWIVLWLVMPAPWWQQLAAFALFRYFDAAKPGPVGWVYLLCFRDHTTGHHAPLRGNGCRGQYAGHYWGWTDDLLRRITQHRNPRWTGAGRLVQVALAAGLMAGLAMRTPAAVNRKIGPTADRLRQRTREAEW